MTDHPDQPTSPAPADESRVQVVRDGVVTATADVSSSPGPSSTATVSFHTRERDLPEHTRSDLVDAVMDSPGVSGSLRVHAVVRRGDEETITRLGERTHNFSARAAGSSSVIDADVTQPDDPDHPV